MPADLAVVTQDPRFGGGVRAQLDAFLEAAVALGRKCEAHYVVHPSLCGDAEPARGTVGVPGVLARLDALNQFAGTRRLAPRLRAARSLWVVATVASAGGAAARTGRPYACWVGSGLADELRSRVCALPLSRRLVLRLNAPALLAVERRVLREARAVYATTPASRRSVAAAAGLPLDQIGILPIAVDSGRFSPLPDEEWLPGLETPTIAFVGRADDPRKNLRLLLDALPSIRRQVPGAHVQLIGRPPHGPLPDGAEAVGPVDSVAEHLRRASLFVLPSLQEGFGIVAAEALACGVPVLTTPSGGPEELVRSSGGGRVLDGWSATELATAATGLLLDRDTLAAMRYSGRAHVVRQLAPSRLQELLAGAFAQLDD